MEKTCENIQQLLVDYADGLLSAAQSKEIESHLEGCTDCKDVLESLQKSLQIAAIIWEDNLADLEAVEITNKPKQRKIHFLRYAAVAAGIMIIAAVSVFFCISQKPQEQETKILTFEEIERSINDAGTAARLFAATELVADYSGAADIVQKQYSYIAKTYPQTAVAEKIRLKTQ